MLGPSAPIEGARPHLPGLLSPPSMSQKDLLTGLGEIHALLGRGTEFEGVLAFEGRVRIDGRFKGRI